MRAGLAIGGVALIVIGIGAAVGWQWSSATEVDGQLDTAISEVRVAAESGDVSIRTAAVPSTSVHEVLHYFLVKPSGTYSVDGNTLVLGDCGWNCTVDYDIVVPQNVVVTGRTDSGDVAVRGAGRVDLRSDSGDIDIRQVAGAVRLQTDSGSVEGRQLAGDADVHADSGDVTLSFDEPADATVHSDSGFIEIAVPPGIYRVAAETDSGSQEIDVPTDPTAAHALTVSADSGDIALHTC